MLNSVDNCTETVDENDGKAPSKMRATRRFKSITSEDQNSVEGDNSASLANDKVPKPVFSELPGALNTKPFKFNFTFMTTKPFDEKVPLPFGG